MDDLDETGVLEAAAAFARVEAFGASGVRAAAAALARRTILEDRTAPVSEHLEIRGLAADELAIRLGVSRRKAARLVGEGRAFEGILGLVGEALVQGEIDASKASLFAEKLAGQPDSVALAISELVLPDAPSLNHHALGQAIDRALVAVDPDGSETRHLAAAARRSIAIRRMSNGMGMLTLHAPMAEVAMVDAVCERAARSARAGGDPRTLEQLRADALTSLASRALADGEVQLRTPGARVRKPHDDGKGPEDGSGPEDEKHPRGEAPSARVGIETRGIVTLQLPAAETLVAADDPDPHPQSSAPVSPPERRPPSLAQVYDAELCRASCDDPTCDCREIDPAAYADVEPHELTARVPELVGFGPLPPAVAIRLAVAPPPWLRVTEVPHPSAAPPPAAPGYRPTAELDRYIRTRDRHCIAPGCGVPASRCDLDHLVAFPDGPTSAENLNALCRHHHLIKTHAGHRLERERLERERVHAESPRAVNAALVWTTALGQRLRRDPATARWHRVGAGVGAGVRAGVGVGLGVEVGVGVGTGIGIPTSAPDPLRSAGQPRLDAGARSGRAPATETSPTRRAPPA